MGSKRFYQLTYQATNEPVYVEDAGNLLKLSGLLLQGMDTNILVLTPQASPDIPTYEIAFSAISPNDDIELPPVGTTTYGLDAIVQPSIEEFSELIRRTDDPLFFEQDETGMVKAVHRKVQMAISGAVQQRIWVRDNFRCLLCGRRMGEVQLSVDHWIPLELGGKNDETNYLSACRKCNKRKGNIHPSKYCLKELQWTDELYHILNEYVINNGNSNHTPDFIADAARVVAKLGKTHKNKS